MTFLPALRALASTPTALAGRLARRWAACLGACAALACASLALAAPAFAQSTPNIVVLLADDLGYDDLGPYDHDQDPQTPEVTNTPVLDVLAAEGVRLSSYYSGASVCTPSRAMLLTGRHHARLGLTGALDPFSGQGLAAGEVTLAEILRARGYATGIFGKWHLGDAPQHQPLAQGFDTFYGVLYSNDMWPFCLWRDSGPIDCNVDQSRLTYNFTVEAKAFVTASVAQQEPFFLYLPYVMPHVPVYVSTAFDGSTGRGLYADTVREIDDSVGQILAHLATLGVADDTLVVFTSDNGPWHYGPPGNATEPWRWVGGSAAPLRGYKGEVYEGGIRVPFVARWADHIPQGTTSDEAIDSADLCVTLAKIAGGTMPQDRVIDGRDAWTALVGGGTMPQRDLLFYRPYRGPSFGTLELRSMRSGRWKLHLSDTLEPAELYDLLTDVDESTPLADPALAAQLADRARVFQCGVGDLLPAPVLGLNLALRRPVAVSSSVQCDTSVDAVDGTLGTAWRSQAGDDQWLEVDLEQSAPLRWVVVEWGAAHALQYRIDVSLDGQAWTPATTVAQCAGGRDVLRLDHDARHVRLRGLASLGGNGYQVRELRVFAASVEGGPGSSAASH